MVCEAVMTNATTLWTGILTMSCALVASPAQASGLMCNAKWQLQRTPDLHDVQFLNSASALAVDDAWAVGDFADGLNPLKPLFLRWDGTAWTEVSGAPLPDGLLRGVAAIQQDDVCAVGGREESNPALTLTEHWDGSSWTVVPAPSPGGRFTGSGFDAVAAVSSSDVWAVGSRGVQDGDRTLVEHWDGSSWKVVTSANASGMDTNILMSVAATASN